MKSWWSRARGDSSPRGEFPSDRQPDPVLTAEREQTERDQTVRAQLPAGATSAGTDAPSGRDAAAFTLLGSPLPRSPFTVGFSAGLGLLVAYGLVHVLLVLGEILTLVVVALFLALGLEPLVAQLIGRGLRRGWAVLVVMLSLIALVTAVGFLLVPTLVHQVGVLVDRAPDYLGDLQSNRTVRELDDRFDVIDRLQREAETSLNGHTLTSVLGGVLGAGRAVLDGVVAVVTVLILTLYLMVALPAVKAAAYKLVPQPRRARVVFLGEEISRRVGGYVLGRARSR